MTRVVVKQSGTAVTGSVYVGTTHSAIQNAINYVSGQGGGEVFIENGIYSIGSTITVPSNIDIAGEGQHTVLKPSSSINVLTVPGTAGTRRKDIYIHDITFGMEVGATTDIAGTGIRLEYVGKAHIANTITSDSAIRGRAVTEDLGVVIERCYFNRLTLGGIDISYGDNVVIEACDFYGIRSAATAYGVQTANSNNVEIADNNFLNCGIAIKHIGASNFGNIFGNTVANTSGDGIDVTGGRGTRAYANMVTNAAVNSIHYAQTEGGFIASNICRNNYDGIFIEYSKSISMEGNISSAISQYAVSYYPDTPGAVIIGNVAVNSGNTGIDVTNSNDVIAIGNSARDNGVDFGFYGTANANQILGNTYSSSSISTGNVLDTNKVG